MKKTVKIISATLIFASLSFFASCDVLLSLAKKNPNSEKTLTDPFTKPGESGQTESGETKSPESEYVPADRTYNPSPMDAYFEDAACTVLKSNYASMSDKKLTDAMTKDGISQDLIKIALKVKNKSWASYEKEFRIQSYKAYSNPDEWSDFLKSSGGSHMANPTGIYATDTSPLYVFVNDFIPENSTLYICSVIGNDLVKNAKSGKKLTKGYNVIEAKKDGVYYILYSASTRSMTKPLNQWPKIKIHIEGGVVNGYYDVTRHTDSDYKKLLAQATNERFTVKGEYSIFNFKTSTYKQMFPDSIEKSILWFDSLTTREFELMGISKTVAEGQRSGAPYYLTGGDSYFPDFYNSPNFAIQGMPHGGIYADSARYRTSYNGDDAVNPTDPAEHCISKSFDITNANFDDWTVAHEVGHNNQGAINLEKAVEVSNNLFSNFIRFSDGIITTSGNPVSQEMDDFANHVPYFERNIWTMTRMYYQLYLYYHQAQHNTAFYPTLFKKLREDPMTYWKNGNSSSLKFVRKVCEVAQEDLTDFFTVWGFFEPCTIVEKDKTLVVTQSEIDACLAEIKKYPKKNREILFIEDRVEQIPTTDFLAGVVAGQTRRKPGRPGEYGDLGQFSSYRDGTGVQGNYTYVRAGSILGMNGSGGVGFLVYDEKGTNGKLLYASNKKTIIIPEGVLESETRTYKVYSVDADGKLKEARNTGNADYTINVPSAGKLESSLPNDAITATIIGKLNGKDVKYLRELIQSHNLIKLDLEQVEFVNDVDEYYKIPGGNSFSTTKEKIEGYMFYECYNLYKITLPASITHICQSAFQNSGITTITIPDKVWFIGKSAFADCDSLKSVYIGKSVRSIDPWAFVNSTYLTDVYIYRTSPPEFTNSGTVFTSYPNIHVYPKALSTYQNNSKWKNCGTFIGDLE